MTQLKIGDAAPTFSLLDQNSQVVESTSLKGSKVLVYFYPKADTPGCTIQSCGLRDVKDEIGEARIIGISPDQPPALLKFDEKYELGFTLLSDPDHEVADSFGVWGEKTSFGKTSTGVIRSAFLIDEDGNLEQVWYGISPADTPTNLVAALSA